MTSRAVLFWLTLFPKLALAYSEPVSFTIRSNEVTFGGEMKTCHLMIDHAGGRNRVNNAQSMTRQPDDNGARVFTITVPLDEGDYIYVFVANVEDFVDLGDPNLNPDDVPDSNFFNDPHPRF